MGGLDMASVGKKKLPELHTPGRGVGLGSPLPHRPCPSPSQPLPKQPPRCQGFKFQTKNHKTQSREGGPRGVGPIALPWGQAYLSVQPHPPKPRPGRQGEGAAMGDGGLLPPLKIGHGGQGQTGGCGSGQYKPCLALPSPSSLKQDRKWCSKPGSKAFCTLRPFMPILPARKIKHWTGGCPSPKHSKGAGPPQVPPIHSTRGGVTSSSSHMSSKG